MRYPTVSRPNRTFDRSHRTFDRPRTLVFDRHCCLYRPIPSVDTPRTSFTWSDSSFDTLDPDVFYPGTTVRDPDSSFIDRHLTFCRSDSHLCDPDSSVLEARGAFLRPHSCFGGTRSCVSADLIPFYWIE